MPPSPDLIDWLNKNSGAVTGLAAVAGVIVAAMYTWLTLQLWRQTKRQAVITEAALEIGHRPFVAVAVDLGPGGNRACFRWSSDSATMGRGQRSSRAGR